MRRQIKIEKRNPKSNTISSYWCEWGTGRMPQHRLMFEYANGAIEIAKSVTATRRVAKKLFKAQIIQEIMHREPGIYWF